MPFVLCNAGHLPISYSSVTLHPHQTIKTVHPEWTAPEWKVEELKTPEWKVEEWKAPGEWQKSEEWKEPVEWKEAEKPANYDFKYEVHDEKTGDIKRQSETAIHGVVKGQYSLIDSDGYKRIVDYTADDHHGFQATVKREPTHYKIPESVKIVKHWW
ncbi:cuticle protein 7-like [Chironomus tepperi]|uniref:cuticle protein 7-like n=1 Tax=Chironomus tepperi TaxID=113505 RepID=UPI00391F673F